MCGHFHSISGPLDFKPAIASSVLPATLAYDVLFDFASALTVRAGAVGRSGVPKLDADRKAIGEEAKDSIVKSSDEGMEVVVLSSGKRTFKEISEASLLLSSETDAPKVVT